MYIMGNWADSKHNFSEGVVAETGSNLLNLVYSQQAVLRTIKLANIRNVLPRGPWAPGTKPWAGLRRSLVWAH